MIAVIGISVAVSRLKPAAPSVSATHVLVWHGQAGTAGARGARRRHARPGGNPLDSGDDVRPRGQDRPAAGRPREAWHGDPRAEQPGAASPRLATRSCNGSPRAATLDERRARPFARSVCSNSRPLPMPNRSSRSRESGPRREQAALRRRGSSADLTIKQPSRRPSTRRSNRARAGEAAARRSREENEKSQLAPQEADVNQKKARLRAGRRQLDDLQGQGGDGRRAAGRAGRGRPAGRPGRQPRARRQPERLSRRSCGSRKRRRRTSADRPGAEVDTRNGIVKGHVIAHRPGRPGRDGRRGRHAGRRAAAGRAAGPERRRHDPARAS